jgi:hypothetical protein
MGLLLVYCGFFKILIRSKPAFRLGLFSFFFRQSIEACIKLVQISARSDLSNYPRLPFSLFVTAAARHLLRFTCLRYSLHLFLDVG